MELGRIGGSITGLATMHELSSWASMHGFCQLSGALATPLRHWTWFLVTRRQRAEGPHT